jgi:hypothetical protein
VCVCVCVCVCVPCVCVCVYRVCVCARVCTSGGGGRTSGRQGILGSTRLYNTYSQTKDLQLRGYLTTDFKGRQVLTKIRADDLELGASSYRGIGQSRTDACKTCKIPLLVETNEHFVLHCAALANARKRHPEVFSWIRERNPERSMAMIILAFPNNATDDIPRAKLVGEFLFDLWSTRATLLELRNTLR